MNAQLADSAIAATVDDRNPWIGLASFTEESRGYFFGRDDEVAELARRVQRKLLTVLFGQSGLGKTSILRAGLVPRLREQGYCPVYVRIDYSKDAPEPADQLKQAIAKTARHSGQWTQAGVAVEGETLWEFLHHRDDMLQDESGKTLIPLLIFDQFEEVFTVAQSDDFGRARAARFIADLADLVENRPPASFEAKLEADEALAEKFDFARSDYRVLISLREDYLAPLEGLKANMPSVTQNRLRLAPMNGKQGLDAVMRPGKKLVSAEVAEAIVRFVAGGAEIANAEVEPSLLSLICRELNDTRIAQGRSEISLDLLAGSHATILSNFYERALADQPAAVRRVIEDELLTDSGFRENIAEERLQKSFATAGAAPDTLATLVNRRLLRIEERLDVRRVELTHDVLCGVVKGSRDLRLEREQREAAEKSLAEQKERAQRTRAALIRARQIATVCIVLAIGAAGAAVYAYFSQQRAQRAENAAQASRVQAENLLGFLTNDFSRELESSGRLEVVLSLAEREVEYFHKLPPDLRGPSTIRMGAIALQQYARAARGLGKVEEARKAVEESESLLTGLRKNGDDSEETTIASAKTVLTHAYVLGTLGENGAGAKVQAALDTLKPYSDKPDASVAVRETEASLYLARGYFQQFTSVKVEETFASLQRAKDIAARHGAFDLSNLLMSEIHVEANAWFVQAGVFGGRLAEARKAAAEGTDLAKKIRELRPGNKRALYAQAVIATNLAGSYVEELRPAESIPGAREAQALQRALVSMDPGSNSAHNNYAAATMSLADALWSLGRNREAVEAGDEAVAAMRQASASGGLTYKRVKIAYLLLSGLRHIEIGDLGAIPRIRTEMHEQLDEITQLAAPGSPVPFIAENNVANFDAQAELMGGNPGAALKRAREFIPRVESAKASEDTLDSRQRGLYYWNDVAARASFELRDFPAAEKYARAALAARQAFDLGGNLDAYELDMESIRLSVALSAQGRRAEAAKILQPVLKRRRERVAQNHGDIDVQFAMAAAIYAQAVIEEGQREVLLNEAATLISRLPREARNLFSTRYLMDLIAEAQIGRTPGTGTSR